MELTDRIRQYIREVPDFPIEGINFKDISPLFLDHELVRSCTHALADHWRGQAIHKVIGIDSRGFLFGPQIAGELEAGFVMVRKEGKLPPETISVSYQLEYGEATLESIKSAVVPGDRVIIHDDLLATGGTAAAAAELVKASGGEVAGFSFIIQLAFLNGKDKLSPFSDDIHQLISYA